MAGKEEAEIRGEGGIEWVEGVIPGELALDLVKPALGGVDLTED